MVKLKGVVVFRSQLGLYGTLICIVLVFVGCESRGSQKARGARKKGLEYAILTTELAAKTCHDTGPGKHRLCLRNNLSHVPDFTDEFIENVAITKNCQKGPRAARDPIRPWSGALQIFASKS